MKKKNQTKKPSHAFCGKNLNPSTQPMYFPAKACSVASLCGSVASVLSALHRCFTAVGLLCVESPRPTRSDPNAQLRSVSQLQG